MSAKWTTVAAHNPHFYAIQVKIVFAVQSSHLLRGIVFLKTQRADALFEFISHLHFWQMR